MKIIRFIKTDLPFALGVPALLWQILFFYFPLLFIIFSSIVKVSHEGYIEKLSLENIFLFIRPLYLKVIASSLILALLNALICLMIGYPVAYFVTFMAKRFKNLFLFFLIVPFWTNFLLHVYAWFFVLEKQGFLNNLLIKFGFIQTPLHLLNSPFAIMVMMVYYYLPFMILPIYSSLERFDFRLIEASLDLGAGAFQTFRRIMLPLTMNGVRSGFFLVYIPSFGEFVIPELMGGDKQMFVGSVISQYILGEGTASLGAAFTVLSAFILLASVILFYFLFALILSRGKRSYA